MDCARCTARYLHRSLDINVKLLSLKKVAKALLLKTGKAPGLDLMTAEMLKADITFAVMVLILTRGP